MSRIALRDAGIRSGFGLDDAVPEAAGGRVVLAIEAVSKSFSGRGQQATEALRSVSLAVRQGEFVSLIGPSGCGKTTLLNMTAGLLRPDDGDVVFDGATLSGPNRKVGYLTQDDALLPWRSILGNVSLPLEIKGVAKAERQARGRDILRRVGLGGFEKHLPAQLSGGMRKRASLARTLVYNPAFLLLDEPFGALDAQTRVIMQRELQRIVRELGLTVMLVTHDLNEAIALSDRILLFSRRPARLIETVTVRDAGRRDVTERTPADDALYRHLWARLAAEIEIDDGRAS
jgi:NitT/TauT family transport system ATP-binding protein